MAIIIHQTRHVQDDDESTLSPFRLAQLPITLIRAKRVSWQIPCAAACKKKFPKAGVEIVQEWKGKGGLMRPFEDLAAVP